MESNTATTTPTREELNAELLEVPEPPEQPESPPPPGFEDSFEVAIRHVKGRRGGDLVGILLVGSGARRTLTPHSDIDLLALVKGETEGHEILRVGERLADIRYHGYRLVEDDLAYSPRLPSLLRKSRILYDHDGVCAKLLDKAHQRFRLLGVVAPLRRSGRPGANVSILAMAGSLASAIAAWFAFEAAKVPVVAEWLWAPMKEFDPIRFGILLDGVSAP